MAGEDFSGKLHGNHDADKLTAESGATIEIKSGGTLDHQSGGTLKFGGNAVANPGHLAKISDLLDSRSLGTATFTIGAEAADVINVAVQLKDANGTALAERAHVLAYLSDTVTTGASITATAAGTLAIGTNGVIIAALVTGKAMWVQSDASGRADINITKTGAQTYYLVVVQPDGSQVVSGAITFAA